MNGRESPEENWVSFCAAPLSRLCRGSVSSPSGPMLFILLISSAVCAAVVRLLLLLRRNLHSGRKLELSAGDNTFARLNALRNHGHVAILFLSRLYLT